MKSCASVLGLCVLADGVCSGDSEHTRGCHVHHSNPRSQEELQARVLAAVIYFVAHVVCCRVWCGVSVCECVVRLWCVAWSGADVGRRWEQDLKSFEAGQQLLQRQR